MLFGVAEFGLDECVDYSVSCLTVCVLECVSASDCDFCSGYFFGLKFFECDVDARGSCYFFDE